MCNLIKRATRHRMRKQWWWWWTRCQTWHCRTSTPYCRRHHCRCHRSRLCRRRRLHRWCRRSPPRRHLTSWWRASRSIRPCSSRSRARRLPRPSCTRRRPRRRLSAALSPCRAAAVTFPRRLLISRWTTSTSDTQTVSGLTYKKTKAQSINIQSYTLRFNNSINAELFKSTIYRYNADQSIWNIIALR